MPRCKPGSEHPPRDSYLSEREGQSFQFWFAIIQELIRLGVARRRPQDPEAVAADVLGDILVDWPKIHERYLCRTPPMPEREFRLVLTKVVLLKTLNATRKSHNQHRRAGPGTGGDRLNGAAVPAPARHADFLIDLENALPAADYLLLTRYFLDDWTLAELAAESKQSISTVLREVNRVEAVVRTRLAVYRPG